jgi:hypothetical protein
MPRLISILAAAWCLAAAAPALAAPQNWAGVAHAIGREGALLPRGAYRVDFPRADLAVRVDGIRIDPAFGLGSFAAFDPLADGSVMVSGDLALTEAEVSPVMKRLVDGGYEITALHQHLLRAVPPILFMHFMAHGDAAPLAKTLRAALDLSGTFARPAPAPPAPAMLDLAVLDRELGSKGRRAGMLVQYLYRRPEAIQDRGMPIVAGTTIAFQPLGGARAAVTGDFALLPGEAAAVVAALRAHDIEVTALHNHMLSEEPHLIYVHVWAVGNAAALARRLRPAVDLAAHRL